MSLTTAVVKSGATWAPTGGTDLTFVPDGRAVKDGLSLVVSGDTNLLTRRSLECKVKMPSAPVNSGYAQLARATLVLRVPFLAADGKLYAQQLRMELATHSEYTDRAVMTGLMAAMAADSDFASFWNSLLLS